MFINKVREYDKEMPKSHTADQPTAPAVSNIQVINSHTAQWRRQNAEKITHIKGRLLDQAAIISNCVPIQNENFSYRKEFAPRGSEIFS